MSFEALCEWSMHREAQPLLSAGNIRAGAGDLFAIQRQFLLCQIRSCAGALHANSSAWPI
jgi:hypothetical protein